MQRSKASERKILNDGDFILVDYVGKIKDSGEVFDLTNEEVAKKENVHKKDFKYGPVPFIVGSEFAIRGLNEALKEMKVGEKKKVEIKPEKGFGERSEELVKLIPEARFRKQNVNVTPGETVTINRLKGKIISVDGGRVKVDFNHPLAGKTLDYEIEIVRQIDDLNEKVASIFFYFIGVSKEDLEIKVENSTAKVYFKEKLNIHQEAKSLITENVFKWIKEINKVEMIDSFERLE